MSADSICGPGGRHVAYVDASFCARCGQPLPARPANAPAATAMFERVRPGSHDAGLLAWVSGRGVLYAVSRAGDHDSLLHLTSSGAANAIGRLPSLNDLVTAPIGTSRGVYFVFPEGVHACVGDGIVSWDAPEGHVLAGATAGGCGELWVAAIAKDGALRLLVAGTIGWRPDDEVRIPGFGGAQNVALTLAARSTRAFRGEILVWGGHKSAIISGRAVVALKTEAQAPNESVRLIDNEATPVLAQSDWRAGDWRLLPAGQGAARAVRLDGATLTSREIPASSGAVLTGSGRLYCASANEVAMFEGPGSDLPRSVQAPVPEAPIRGACPLFDSAVVQDNAGKLWLCSGIEARPLERGADAPDAGADSSPVRRLMPPVRCQDAIWAARATPQGLAILRLNIAAAPSVNAARERAHAP